MTSIDRTAYPHLKSPISKEVLSGCYDLDDAERRFVRRNARNNRGYLVVAAMLKTRQHLGYFIPLEQVPHQIVVHLSRQLRLPDTS